MWRPRVQTAVLAAAERLAAGGALPVEVQPAPGFVVVYTAADGVPSMIVVQGVDKMRVEQPGGGYVGLLCDTAAGHLYIANATGADVTDIQVTGLRLAPERPVGAGELVDPHAVIAQRMH